MGRKEEDRNWLVLILNHPKRLQITHREYTVLSFNLSNLLL